MSAAVHVIRVSPIAAGIDAIDQLQQGAGPYDLRFATLPTEGVTALAALSTTVAFTRPNPRHQAVSGVKRGTIIAVPSASLLAFAAIASALDVVTE